MGSSFSDGSLCLEPRYPRYSHESLRFKRFLPSHAPCTTRNLSPARRLVQGGCPPLHGFPSHHGVRGKLPFAIRSRNDVETAACFIMKLRRDETRRSQLRHTARDAKLGDKGGGAEVADKSYLRSCRRIRKRNDRLGDQLSVPLDHEFKHFLLFVSC